MDNEEEIKFFLSQIRSKADMNRVKSICRNTLLLSNSYECLHFDDADKQSTITEYNRILELCGEEETRRGWTK